MAHGIAAIGELLAWTADARAKQKAERDAEILSLANEGKTQREIAEEVGCDHKTVGNVLNYGEKRTVSEIPQVPANQPDANLQTPPPSGVFCARYTVAAFLVNSC